MTTVISMLHGMGVAPLSYASGVSAVPLLGETIGENLERVAARHSNRQALVDMATGRRWTYAELDAVHERDDGPTRFGQPDANRRVARGDEPPASRRLTALGEVPGVPTGVDDEGRVSR